MTYETPALSRDDQERLSRLRDISADSRSLFDTFVLHADYLIRFTDDLLKRADGIEFPLPPSAPSVARRNDPPAIIRLDEPPAPSTQPPLVAASVSAPTRRPSTKLPLTPRHQQPPPAPKVVRGPASPKETPAGSPRTAPVVVVIGPVDRLGEIENLTIELESMPEIDVHFRLFRAGAYRVDASCSDIEGLTRRLRTRKDVLSVDRHGPTIHVLPAPLTL